MTGWNLPPGCNVHDLPGNSREEEQAEALYDKLADAIAVLDLDNETTRKALDKLVAIVGDVYARGYADGMADRAS
jgi:hypothetical protein